MADSLIHCQHQTCAGELCAAVNATTLALVDAGIPYALLWSCALSPILSPLAGASRACNQCTCACTHLHTHIHHVQAPVQCVSAAMATACRLHSVRILFTRWS